MAYRCPGVDAPPKSSTAPRWNTTYIDEDMETLLTKAQSMRPPLVQWGSDPTTDVERLNEKKTSRNDDKNDVSNKYAKPAYGNSNSRIPRATSPGMASGRKLRESSLKEVHGYTSSPQTKPVFSFPPPLPTHRNNAPATTANHGKLQGATAVFGQGQPMRRKVPTPPPSTKFGVSRDQVKPTPVPAVKSTAAKTVVPGFRGFEPEDALDLVSLGPSGFFDKGATQEKKHKASQPLHISRNAQDGIDVIDLVFDTSSIDEQDGELPAPWAPSRQEPDSGALAAAGLCGCESCTRQKAMKASCETEDSASINTEAWGARPSRVSGQTESFYGANVWDHSAADAAKCDWEAESECDSASETQMRARAMKALGHAHGGAAHHHHGDSCHGLCRSSKLLSQQAAQIKALEERLAQKDASIRLLSNKSSAAPPPPLIKNTLTDPATQETLHRLEVRLAVMEAQQPSFIQHAMLKAKVDMLARKVDTINISTPSVPESDSTHLAARLTTLESTISRLSDATTDSQAQHIETQTQLRSLRANIDAVTKDHQTTVANVNNMRDHLNYLLDTLEQMGQRDNKENDKTKSKFKHLTNGIEDLTSACERLSELHDELSGRVDGLSKEEKDEVLAGQKLEALKEYFNEEVVAGEKLNALKEYFSKLLRYVDGYNWDVPRGGLKTPLHEMSKLLGVEMDLTDFETRFG